MKVKIVFTNSSIILGTLINKFLFLVDLWSTSTLISVNLLQNFPSRHFFTIFNRSTSSASYCCWLLWNWIVCFYNCVCVKYITLCNYLCSSSPSSPSSPSASVIRNIGKFWAKNYFTDHQTANTIYRFRDSFRSLKYMSVIRIRKNLSNIPFLSKPKR